MTSSGHSSIAPCLRFAGPRHNPISPRAGVAALTAGRFPLLSGRTSRTACATPVRARRQGGEGGRVLARRPPELRSGVFPPAGPPPPRGGGPAAPRVAFL